MGAGIGAWAQFTNLFVDRDGAHCSAILGGVAERLRAIMPARRGNRPSYGVEDVKALASGRHGVVKSP